MEQDHRRQQAIGGVATSVIRCQRRASALRVRAGNLTHAPQQISPHRVQGALIPAIQPPATPRLKVWRAQARNRLRRIVRYC